MTMKSDLGLAQIWDLIEVPAASFSITKRERLKAYLPDSEAIATAYHRCEAMQKSIGSSPRPMWHKILSQFSGINAHFYAKGITLGSSELFDLKSWLYQYQILRKYTQDNALTHYILPDLQPLFSILDPESTGLPSFRLSPLQAILCFYLVSQTDVYTADLIFLNSFQHRGSGEMRGCNGRMRGLCQIFDHCCG